jgi:hypothetical protein
MQSDAGQSFQEAVIADFNPDRGTDGGSGKLPLDALMESIRQMEARRKEIEDIEKRVMAGEYQALDQFMSSEEPALIPVKYPTGARAGESIAVSKISDRSEADLERHMSTVQTFFPNCRFERNEAVDGCRVIVCIGVDAKTLNAFSRMRSEKSRTENSLVSDQRQIRELVNGARPDRKSEPGEMAVPCETPGRTGFGDTARTQSIATR